MSAPKKQQGFTLIELMVTISIIAILAAVGIVVYSSAQKSGRISKRVQDLKAIQGALELYKSATGGYPAQNGWVCIGPAALGDLVPNYMPILPADPLDNGNAAGTNCYEYTSGGETVTTEYKIRTNANLAAVASGPEMSSANFGQQPSMIDPVKDTEATPNCTVLSGATYSGWALYSGLAVCDD